MFVLLRTKGFQLRINVQPCRHTVKRSKHLKGYASTIYGIYSIKFEICAREWDFTSQVVWWCCAFAHLRGNTPHERRDEKLFLSSGLAVTRWNVVLLLCTYHVVPSKF